MKYLIFILLFYCDLLFGQVQTNIDLNILKPAWMVDNLKNETFRNGDKIDVIYDVNDWRYYNSESKKNKPVLLIINTKNGVEYLYNFYAFNDKRNIIPKNYRIPLLEDFINIEFYNKDIPNYNLNKFVFSSSSNIFWDDLKEKFQVSNFNNFQSYVWTNNNYNDGNEFWFAEEINKNDSEFTSKETFFLKSCGLPIRCIENFDETLKDTTLDYSIYLPNEFSLLKNKFIAYLTYKDRIKNNQKIIFSGELVFDSKGNNVSQIGDFNTEISQDISNDLSLILMKWSNFPFYNDLKIKSKTNIDFEFIKHKDIIEKNDNFALRVISNSINSFESDFKSCFAECISRGFNYLYFKSDYDLRINQKFEKFENKSTLKKVIGKGPLISVLAIIPGLGLHQITKNTDTIYSHKKLKNTILTSSIIVGFIGLSSKIISSYYYNSYKSQLNSSNARNYFEIANMTQKIFLTSLYTYSALSLIDFTFTFKIGVKNKSIQHKMNKQIRNLKQPLIIY
jgi:hypothetical protein